MKSFSTSNIRALLCFLERMPYCWCRDRSDLKYACCVKDLIYTFKATPAPHREPLLSKYPERYDAFPNSKFTKDILMFATSQQARLIHSEHLGNHITEDLKKGHDILHRQKIEGSTTSVVNAWSWHNVLKNNSQFLEHGADKFSTHSFPQHTHERYDGEQKRYAHCGVLSGKSRG